MNAAGEKTEAGPTRRTLVGVYAALIALLVLTVGAAWLPLHAWAVPVALAIAGAKTALVFLFFMQVRYQRGLVPLFAVAGFYWLALIGALTFADYLTRG